MKTLLLVCVMALSACKGILIDTTMSAAQAGDATIVMSSGGIPSQGFDVLRVEDGTKITSSWKIIIPVNKFMTGAELVIRYKDRKRTYALNGASVSIPWKDIIGDDTWNIAHNGVAQVTAQIQYKTKTSDANFIDILGYTFIRVFGKGYLPLPTGSPYGAFKATCTVEYSSNGRSAVSCK